MGQAAQESMHSVKAAQKRAAGKRPEEMKDISRYQEVMLGMHAAEVIHEAMPRTLQEQVHSKLVACCDSCARLCTHLNLVHTHSRVICQKVC